jgi:hypothetical protein
MLVISLIAVFEKVAIAQNQNICSNQEPMYALPGDLIVRHGENILGPPLLTGISLGKIEDIPHIGLLLRDGKVLDLRVKNVNGEQHGIIHKCDWFDTSRFKNPGFFSVLESSIPIRFNGNIMTFKDLPNNVKIEVREKVCNIAENYIEKKDVGKYSLTYHCGDVTIQIYDKALTEIGITVLRYKGLSTVRRDERGLIDGKLRDWFVNDWLTMGSVMDPSEINDKLPRVAPPQIKTLKQSGQLKPAGVYIDSEPVSIDRGGKKLKDETLDSRPSEDTLFWPIELPNEEE